MCLCFALLVSVLLFFFLSLSLSFLTSISRDSRTIDRANEGQAAKIGKEIFAPFFFVRCTIPGGRERGKEPESVKIAEHENRGGNAENRLGRLQSRCRWEKLPRTIREHSLPLSFSHPPLSLFLSTTRKHPDYCKTIWRYISYEDISYRLRISVHLSLKIFFISPEPRAA